MKAPAFAYAKAATLRQALDLLAAPEGSAIPLAGGQSLMATLNLRLSSPQMLVDISELDELKGIRMNDTFICIGAGTTFAQMAASPLVQKQLPLMAEALRHVAHVAIRNRGTIGGSLAYADPAAEMPACSVALDATFVLAGEKGERAVAATEFYRGLFETDLGPGELLIEARFPRQEPNQKWGFGELARRHGDFALAGLAAVAREEGGTVVSARLVYFGCTDRAKLARRVADQVCGHRTSVLDPQQLSEAIVADLAPTDSPGLRAATKVRLASVLTTRTLAALRPVAPVDRAISG